MNNDTISTSFSGISAPEVASNMLQVVLQAHLLKYGSTVKLGKAEPRWRPGIWLRSIETSDEHLVGTELGVIKARSHR